jgi:hypothetical protein
VTGIATTLFLPTYPKKEEDYYKNKSLLKFIEKDPDITIMKP